MLFYNKKYIGQQSTYYRPVLLCFPVDNLHTSLRLK